MTSLTWASSTTPPPNTTKWTSICCGNNKFVAVGRDVGAAVYSTDGGDSWTTASSSIQNVVWNSVTFGIVQTFPKFVAISSNSTTVIMYSSDGINWYTSGISGEETGNWKSICRGNGYFVAVSSNSVYQVMYSQFGTAWSPITVTGASTDWRSVCYGNPSSIPTFVAVGTNAFMYSTDDGSTWTISSAITAGTWYSVSYGNSTFVAVGANGSNGICMASPDGINWTDHSYSPVADSPWYSVCFADNGTIADFVAVDGNGNSITSSDNGTSWTVNGIMPTGTWLSVTYDPIVNNLAAVSYDTTTNQGTYAVLLCFKEGSKILTDKGYVEIQNLRKGDSVQTLKDGFKKIVFLGKRIIEQNSLEERIKDQLYKYSSKEYPELFEELVLTGGHSILVDSLTDEERENMRITMFDLFKGEDFEIDDKKCLLSYLNNKAEVYEKKGKHTIYHFALEGDYYKNYGVYANGLLVEACSQHIFLEYVHPDTTFCQRTLFYLLFILTHFSDITEFVKSKSMGLLKMRRKLKNEKDSFSEFHSIF